MKLTAALAFLLGSPLILALGAGEQAGSSQDNQSIVVGTFDSRALVVAHVGSAAFQEYVSEQKADIGRAVERALDNGDTDLAQELEALGPAMQRRIHERGFGKAPVDDLVARIEGELPRIAREAGVDVIVSKWNLAYAAPAATFVDVTERLVAEFDPSEETLQGIRELVAQDPVPLDELQHDH